MMRQNGHLPMKQLGADRIMFVHRAPGQGFTTVRPLNKNSQLLRRNRISHKTN